MSEPVHRFVTHPSNLIFLQLDPESIPPLEGDGVQFARSAFLFPRVINPESQRPPGVEFENVTIEFPIDLLGGAGSVPNDDNWGVGPGGYDAQRFWDLGARGKGVRVGIADSGLDLNHPCFSARVAAGREVPFAHFDSIGQAVASIMPTFSHWHGTHCAAVLVGEPTSGKRRGLAPDADLAVARVLGAGNSGTVASVLAGLWWLVDQKCDVISLSLGWPGFHEEWAAPVEAMLAAGTVVVAASGNEFGLPGEKPTRSPANYPIAPSHQDEGLLVTVGAADVGHNIWDRSGGEVADWSGVMVKRSDGSMQPSRYATSPPQLVPTLVGPGIDVVSAIPNGEYLSSTGTSMATPHLAGLIVLALSFLRKTNTTTKPRAAAERVLQHLIDLPIAGPDTRSGRGRVDFGGLITDLVST